MSAFSEFAGKFVKKDEGDPWIGFLIGFLIPVITWLMNGMDQTKFFRTAIFGLLLGSVAFYARQLKRGRQKITDSGAA